MLMHEPRALRREFRLEAQRYEIATAAGDDYCFEGRQVGGIFIFIRRLIAYARLMHDCCRRWPAWPRAWLRYLRHFSRFSGVSLAKIQILIDDK